MRAIIVESPSKCKKIQSILQELYPIETFRVIATCGHFRDIKSIDDQSFSIHFEITPSKISTVQNLRKTIQDAEETIIATDDDREGESIGWHVCELFHLHLSHTKRIKFHEITSEALFHAMEHPDRINKNIVEAQMTRMICDRWIGYKISPFLWNKINNTKLSAGRCQTPTLKLIEERETEISKTIPNVLYKIRGVFQGLEFSLRKELETHQQCMTFLDQSKLFEHEIIHNKARTSTRKPPDCFTTSTLQQNTSTLYSWSPVHTMSLAQSLYEKGFITYHRTESKLIAKEFQEKILNHIRTTYGDEYCGNMKGPSKSTTAHECIRPTKITQSIENITTDENRLYKLIWTQTIQSMMKDAKIHIRCIRISCPIKKTYYEKSFETIDFLGFKILENKSKTTKQDFQSGEKMVLTTLTMEQHVKDIKSHYTEGQIVKLLDEKKIGRPSTFSTFVNKILSRSYAEKGKFHFGKFQLEQIKCTFPNEPEITTHTKEHEETNKIILTKLGKQVCELLYENFSELFNYEYTATMEETLDKIATGNLDRNPFLQELKKNLDTISISKYLRTLLDPDFYQINIRKGKFGNYLFLQKSKEEKPTFLSLSDFSHDYLKCDETLVFDFIKSRLPSNE